MHRFFNWLNSRHFTNRWRSTSSVAPSSGSYSQEKASSLGLSNSTSTKQVHFADDCGEALESIHIIPLQVSKKKAFQESLEEAYIDCTGIVTGVLNVSQLEPGRNILVRYTENAWKTHKQTKARPFDKTEYNKVFGMFNDKNNRSDTDDDSYETSSGDETVKFAFGFKVAKRQLVNVELVIISTLDGAVDQRHEQGYKLSKSFATVAYVPCVTCWG